MAKLTFTSLSLHPTLCSGSSCDYIRVNNEGYDVKIADPGHVVYAADYEFYVEFFSDGSGTGAAFTASLSFLGESYIAVENIKATYTCFIGYM